MILAEKPLFSTNFNQKSNKHSSTIVLPWKQWVSHQTHMCLKRKLVSLYYKSESFSFLPFTVLAQQREKHGCGWIPPPGLNRVNRHLDHMVSYQGKQSGLPVFVVGEFSDFEIFMQNDCFASLMFPISPTGNVKNRSYLDRISSYAPIY